MEAKKKNVNVFFAESRKVPDVSISFSIKFKAGGICLSKLRCNYPCQESCKGCYYASLSYAMYESVRDKLMGSPLELSRSRVSNIKCKSLGNDLVLSWNTAPTFSAIRKSLVLAVSCLTPHKFYSKYSDNAKLMGIKPDRSEFNGLVEEFIKSVKDGISVAIVGKARLDKSKLQQLADKMQEKIPPQKSDSPRKKIPQLAELKSEHPSWEAKGLGAALAVDYIQLKSNGMHVELAGNKIYVYSKSWDSKKKSLKPRIKDYVDKKYKKLGIHLGGVLAYLISTQCHGSVATIKAASKIKPEKIFDLIKASF